MRLTDLQIKKLRAPDKGQKTYFDDGLRGFGVRVSQGGSKSFVVMFGEKRRLKTLGRYPDISLAEARIEAKRFQADVAMSEQVTAERLPAVSFLDARMRFLRDSEARNKPRTTEEYRRLLERHFHFDQGLAEITRSDIMGVVETLGATPSEQRHAFVAIRTLMNWALKHGLIDSSPVPALRYSTQSRSRFLTDSELVMVWARAVEVGYPFGSMVQLLILTGQRRGEVAGLRRSWIEDNYIHFPEGFTKNKREHRTPLCAMAQQIIDDIPMSGDLLFPARGRVETPFSGWSKAKSQFDKPLEIEPYTLHDLRRTFASTLARLGTPIHVTEKILNHVSGTVSGVAAVYNRHSYDEEMRTAIDAYEIHIQKLVGTTSN